MFIGIGNIIGAGINRISGSTEAANFETRVEADGGVYEASSCQASKIDSLANFYNGFSLLTIPHGYKESKLYSTKPTSGAGDFTFTRAGTKVRKGPSLVETVPYNLLQYSQQFDNAYWVKSNAAVVANNTTAPDGTTTADKLNDDTVNTSHAVVSSTTKSAVAVAYTATVYAKAAQLGWVILNADDGTANNGSRAWFNISTGVVGTINNSGYTNPFTSVTSSITAKANGWYKCIFKFTTNAAGTVRFNIATSTGDAVLTYAGSGTGIYIWQAQLVVGSTEKDDFVTTNRQNVPHLGYTGGTCPHLTLEPSRTNLLLQSEDIGTTWTNIGTTESLNATTAPDGTSTADKLQEDNTNGTHAITQDVSKAASALTYTFSWYAKAAERSWVRLLASNGANFVSVFYNLSTGVVGTQSTTGFTIDSTPQITDEGNGWYRCSVVFTSDTGTSLALRAYVQTADNEGTSYQGTTGSGIYLWGAQLEQASYLTSYIPTTTATVTRVADAVTAIAPGYNILLRSQEFDNASWVKTACSISANNTTAPDGTTTADKFVEDSTTAVHFVSQNTTKAAVALPYTISVYAKAAERTWLRVGGNDGASGNALAWFDLANGVKGSLSQNGSWTVLSSSIKSVGNGWYRCSVTFSSNTVTTIQTHFTLSTGDNVASYAGDGSSGLFIWGAQTEAAYSATTYVATTTAAANNGEVIGQTEGTIYFEGSSFADSTSKNISISDGTANNRIRITFGSTNAIAGIVESGGVVQANISTAFTTGTNYKAAIVYRNNYVAFFLNGVKVGEDTSATIPVCSQINFDAISASTGFYGKCKVFALSKTARTDSQAIALTT